MSCTYEYKWSSSTYIREHVYNRKSIKTFFSCITVRSHGDPLAFHNIFPSYFSKLFLHYAHGKQLRVPPLHISLQLFRFPLQCTLLIPPSSSLTIVLHTSAGNDKHVRYFNRNKRISAADTAYRSVKWNTIAGSKWRTSSFIIPTIHWTYYRGTILVFFSVFT